MQVLLARSSAARQANQHGNCDFTRSAESLVVVAARHAGGSCLAQAIVLRFLLERRGVPARLPIGVLEQGEESHAHAWVEAAGIRLNERFDTRLPCTAFDRDFSQARDNL